LAPSFGESLGGRVATAAVKHGLTGAAETAIFNAANEADESVLGDTDMTAEKLWSAMGHGAAMGLLFGAGIGGAGELAATGGRALLKLSSPVTQRLAESQMGRALMHSSDTASMRAAEDLPGGARAMERRFLQDGVPAVGDTVDSLAPKMRQGMEAAGEDVGATIRLLDQTGREAPEVNAVTRTIDEEIAKALRETPGMNKSALRELDTAVSDMRSFVGNSPTYERWWQFRRKLDDTIRYNKTLPLGAPVDVSNVTLRQIRGVIERHIEDGVDKLESAPGLPNDWLARYKDTKLRYAQYRVGTAMAEKGALRKATNAGFAPSSMGVGVASGNPYAILKGLAAAVGHKILRERGNATMAVALDKISTVGSIQRSINKIDTNIDSAIDGFLKPSNKIRLRAKAYGKTFDERYDEARRNVEESQKIDPERAERNMQRYGRHIPAVAAALGSIGSMTNDFLVSKLPPDRTREDALQPLATAPRNSDFEKGKFLRYYEAAEEGSRKVADEIRSGRIHPETIEYMEAVQPKSLAHIRQKFSDKVAAGKTNLPFNKEVQVAALLGVSLPSFKIAPVLQATFANQAKPSMKPPSSNIRTAATADSMKLLKGP
jgi:hypothetical protein